MTGMSALVTPAEVAAELNTAKLGTAELGTEHGDAVLALLDAQYELGGTPGHELYARAHLPGARFIDVDAELAGPPGAGGRHPLPDPDHLQESVRRLGLHAHTRVVVYDQGNGMGSARAWWVLGWAGLTDIRVLDGGLAAWVAEGHPVTDAPTEPAAPGSYRIRTGALPVLDAESAGALAASGLLLDARAPERFAGESEPIDPVAGHIPGARNAPLSEITGPDGRLVDRERLHEIFTRLGVFEHAEVGTYCGSGITAARLALALREVGVTPSLYAGSWSEWITDPARPVATGPDRGPGLNPLT